MSTDKNLKELIVGVMVDDDADMALAITEFEKTLINTFYCFRQDANGTFIESPGGVMPASMAMGVVDIRLVDKCQFVDPLIFSLDYDESAFKLSHDRIPCFLECKHDEHNATRIYINMYDRHFIGINVTYEEPGSPYMPAEAVAARVMPMAIFNTQKGFASFWNLTQRCTEEPSELLHNVVVTTH